jgi:hypothetical protein
MALLGNHRIARLAGVVEPSDAAAAAEMFLPSTSPDIPLAESVDGTPASRGKTPEPITEELVDSNASRSAATSAAGAPRSPAVRLR